MTDLTVHDRHTAALVSSSYHCYSVCSAMLTRIHRISQGSESEDESASPLCLLLKGASGCSTSPRLYVQSDAKLCLRC